MRMSMSPQKSGFHRCTGGGPFLATPDTADISPSAEGFTMNCASSAFAICARPYVAVICTYKRLRRNVMAEPQTQVAGLVAEIEALGSRLGEAPITKTEKNVAQP